MKLGWANITLKIIYLFLAKNKQISPFQSIGRIFWSFGPNTLRRTWQHCWQLTVSHYSTYLHTKRYQTGIIKRRFIMYLFTYRPKIWEQVCLCSASRRQCWLTSTRFTRANKEYKNMQIWHATSTQQHSRWRRKW